MIELLIAAMLMQSEPAACNAVPRPAALPAGCVHWRLLRITPTGASHIRPAAVRRDGAMVEVLNRIVLPETSPLGARSIIGLVRLDCRQRTAMMVHITAFDPGGGLILDSPVPDPDPAPAQPSSPYGDMVVIFC